MSDGTGHVLWAWPVLDHGPAIHHGSKDKACFMQGTGEDLSSLEKKTSLGRSLLGSLPQQEGCWLEKPVVLMSEGEQMLGVLHLPQGEGPFPAVALYHGFTGTKVEAHRIFVKMARALSKAGIAAVRFDFRGSGDSAGDFDDMTVSGEIIDARRVLDFLQEQEAVAGERLGVLGLSMGGAVAASVAGQDRRVKSLALWAAVAQFSLFEGQEELVEQARACGHADVGGNVLKYAFYEDSRKQDPLKWVSAYGGPALIVHGDGDPTVPVAHAHLYFDAISGTKEKFIIPGADHTFNSHEWETAVIEKTAAWFVDTL